MILEFKVQGGQEQPYTLTFTDDTGLKSTCSCPAGEKKYLCKHVLWLLEGDITNLASNNTNDINTLHNWLNQDSNVKDLYLHYYDSIEAQKKLNKIRSLAPNRRRKSIDIEFAVNVLESNGFFKGKSNYLDLYDSENEYLGSIKAPSSVFTCNVKSFLGIKNLRVWTREDFSIDSKFSSALYCFLKESRFEVLEDLENNLRDRKIILSKTIVDRSNSSSYLSREALLEIAPGKELQNGNKKQSGLKGVVKGLIAAFMDGYKSKKKNM